MSINHLKNEDTVKALKEQLTFESMNQDKVLGRVYSSFDGRIIAKLDKENQFVSLTAYSWDKVKVCVSVDDAIKFLLKEAFDRAMYFKKLKDKNKKENTDFKISQFRVLEEL